MAISEVCSSQSLRFVSSPLWVLATCPPQAVVVPSTCPAHAVMAVQEALAPCRGPCREDLKVEGRCPLGNRKDYIVEKNCFIIYHTSSAVIFGARGGVLLVFVRHRGRPSLLLGVFYRSRSAVLSCGKEPAGCAGRGAVPPGSLSPEDGGVRCSLGPESLSIFSKPWCGCFGATLLNSIIILPVNKT